VRRGLLLAACVLVLAGCGGDGHAHGTATLWITRDRGAHVLYAGRVPAGLTAMQALARKQKLTTRYGGRFVQSIGGLEGSLAAERDWFFFVDGLEGGRSAAEVKLHDGDIEWWDYRSWHGGAMSVPVVVGSYPEPFLHGLPGKTSVVGGDKRVARAIAKQVHGVVDATAASQNVIKIGGGLPANAARIRRSGSGVLLELGAATARRLAHNPRALRYRY
jgi:uncharacterized protein DUF4430